MLLLIVVLWLWWLVMECRAFHTLDRRMTLHPDDDLRRQVEQVGSVCSCV